MADPPIDGKSLVWLWVIEYLASFRQIDSSVLHKLIEQAPAFPTDFAKNARERVALRCLEDLYASTNAVGHGVPSAPEPKVVIDLSDSCEDVIQAILRETSMSDLKKGGPELLKWDFQPFILHKKASMPKCALEQLKETIVKGSDSIPAWLAKFSGLVRENEDVNRTFMEEDGRVEEPSRIDHQTEVSGEKFISQPPVNRQGAVGEDLLDNSHGAASMGEQERVHSGDCQRADTELDTLHSNMACDNDLVKVTEKDDCHLRAESLRGVTVEEREHSSQVGNVSGKTAALNIQAEEENGRMGHPSEEDTQRDSGGCAHERVNDDTKISKFMSSQGLLSKDFLAAADLSGSNLCVKCSRNGHLLYCGTDGCPLAIHESCLGIAPSLDNRGKFCCPFCAYSLAISDYTKIKERTSVTLKQLSAFLHEGSENPSIERAERLFENEIRSFVEREGNQGNNGKDVDEGNDDQFQNGTDRVQLRPVPAHCVSNQPTSEQEPSDVLCVSRGTGESQIKGTTPACPSVRVPERKQDLDLPEPPCFGDNLSRENKDVVSEEHGQAKGATEKEVPEEIPVHKLVVPIRAVPMGGGPSDNENHRAMSPNHSLILTKRKRKDVVSSPRRQQVKWTAAEEKTLKEGVEKFSNHGKQVPWKSILEYGRSVFGDIRNPEDLRSKWKKMCKRKPKC